MSTTLYEQYDSYGPLSRVAGLDLAFDVRFGGKNSRVHPMWLRLGPVEHDDTVLGHLLVEIGTRVDVVRDVVVWDHAVRAFVLGDTREINRLTEQLDLTAAIFGELGRFFEGTVTAVSEILKSLLLPSFFVIGSLGTILFVFIMYYVILYLLAHWAIWFVLAPSAFLSAVCTEVCRARRDKLRTAVLATANDAFRNAI
jgi:hypothetical protein